MTRAEEAPVLQLDTEGQQAPDASRPHWMWEIIEETLVEYKGSVEEFSFAIRKAREPDHMGPMCKLYNHNLGESAVRGSLTQKRIVPRVLKTPVIAFQPKPDGSLAAAFTLADCGYASDIVLAQGFSLSPGKDYLIPVKAHPLFRAFASSLTVNSGQYVHLRQE